jgi:hypothetical protein
MRTYGITYKSEADSPSFEGYADAAFQDKDDGKSTTGYVFIAAGGVITWRSGKQTVTAQSSTEAEYIAIWEGGKEVSWLRNLYQELGLTQRHPTVIKCDNTGAVQIAKNPIFHKRTKHINSRFHWVREKVQAGRFDAIIIRDKDQTADVLTKALPRPKHQWHTKEMGISSV